MCMCKEECRSHASEARGAGRLHTGTQTTLRGVFPSKTAVNCAPERGINIMSKLFVSQLGQLDIARCTPLTARENATVPIPVHPVMTYLGVSQGRKAAVMRSLWSVDTLSRTHVPQMSISMCVERNEDIR